MDWNTIILAVIAATVPIATAYLAYLTHKNGKKTDALHVVVNSRLTELLAATASASKAEGKAEGAATERERNGTP